MRTRRLLAALGIPLFAVACATGSVPVIGSSSGDGGGGEGNDASYGADSSSSSDGGGSDGGARPIDSGSSGGDDSGGGGALVTPGGDCIGDPGAPFGYDFACQLAESLGSDSPCTPDAGMCASGSCCFTDKSSKCYASYGTQCVPYM